MEVQDEGPDLPRADGGGAGGQGLALEEGLEEADAAGHYDCTA